MMIPSKTPTVSICVPIYNVEKYIEGCARSLFEQTYPQIHYVFVDDGSKDNSISILMHLIEDYQVGDKCVIIKHNTNCGIAATRNSAIENIVGDYILWVDSDDWLEIDAVDFLISRAKQTDADITLFDSLIHYEFSHETKRQPSFDTISEFSRAIITRTAPQELWGKLYKSSLYSESVRCEPGVNMAEDWLLLVKLIPHVNTVDTINKSFYHYDRTIESALTRRGGEIVERTAWRAFMAAKTVLTGTQFEDIIKETELRLSAISLFNYAKWENADYFYDIATEHITSETLCYIEKLSFSQKVAIILRNNKLLLKIVGKLWLLRRR